MNNQAPTDTPNKYDPHIVPAETAARQEREGANFAKTPHAQDDQNREVGAQVPADSIDTTGGYTVDKEGLANNFAIEPEMYVDEPGDLREKEAAEAAERKQEVADLGRDKDGDLTMEQDKRGRGPGII